VYDPPVESLEEMNVEISNYKAELGRSGGGYVQMTTKSGTNELHGSLYEFLRNDKLDARNFFAASKPVLRYNQFGASLGGPIRKDRTFFFLNYEGLIVRRQQTVLASVPSVAEVSGDFSALTTTVRDPITNTPFPGNIIPTTRLDPVGAAIAALYPAPNVAGARSRSNNFRLTNQPARQRTSVWRVSTTRFRPTTGFTADFLLTTRIRSTHRSFLLPALIHSILETTTASIAGRPPGSTHSRR
jgi:hypothetical protein